MKRAQRKAEKARTAVAASAAARKNKKAEKAKAAAAAAQAADDKANHDAPAPVPADVKRAERSANARELLHSTDPSAALLEGNATEAFESDPSSALAHLHISTGIHVPGMFALGRIALGTCPEGEVANAVLSATAALTRQHDSTPRNTQHTTDIKVRSFLCRENQSQPRVCQQTRGACGTKCRC